MNHLGYIRGRSIPDSIISIDEAQNLSKEEEKTIITRAAEGTKIILTGDPSQVDNPYLDKTSNGLVYLVDKMKGSNLVGQVHLVKTVRSRLAELAAEKL
jgi:PhoH-like ATPase